MKICDLISALSKLPADMECGYHGGYLNNIPMFYNIETFDIIFFKDYTAPICILTHETNNDLCH